MLLSVSIACFNQADTTRRCLEHLRRRTRDLSQIEFLLTNNGSTDGTQKLLEEFPLPHKLILNHGYNTGFGLAHNLALERASGDYFLVMNNDIFLRVADWLGRALAPFKDAAVGLVGLKGTPCTLIADGRGRIGTQVDYLDGSFLLGRTETFREYGLFSPAIRRFFFEDSSLSLRYRQMGYRLAQVHIPHEHHRSTTVKTISQEEKDRVIAANRRIFLARWSTYLTTRQLHNAVLVQIPSLGIGDVISSTPTLEALRRDHPTARIVVETLYPDVFLNNPFVSEVTQKAGAGPYDRTIRLSPDFKKPVPVWKLCEEIAATTVSSGRPQIYLSNEEIGAARQAIAPLRNRFDRVFIFNPLMRRTEWEGRCWNIEEARRFLASLNGTRAGIVEVGKDVESTGRADLDLVNKTSLRELFALMAEADGFIGIDSLCLHIAQAFKKPIWALFGATEPIARIVDFRNTEIVRAPDLACVGCYNKWPTPGINKCSRKDGACMRGITAEMVLDAVEDKGLNKTTIDYLQNLILAESAQA